MPSQRARRERESCVRRHVVECCTVLKRLGSSLESAATRIGLAPGTVRSWLRRGDADGLEPRPRGRRPARATRSQRESLLTTLRTLGPRTGVARLQALVPELARREVAEFVRRVRYATLRRRRATLHVLRWLVPGAVWAMDHADPPSPIDGIYPKLLIVRDLASGLQLAAKPVLAGDAASVLRELLTLFARWGAPLVLESDNGSPLVAQEVAELLSARGVLPLISPPSLPSYNGSVEAGVGSVRVIADHRAALCDRPGMWTCADVEAARAQANETARPWGPLGPTPAERWRARPAVPTDLRERVHESYRIAEVTECRLRGMLAGVVIDPYDQRSIDRVAIAHALVEHKILEYRRGRMSLAKPTPRTADIP